MAYRPSHIFSTLLPSCRGSVASKAHQVLLSVLENLVVVIKVTSKILFPTSRLSVHPLVSPLCVQRLAPIPAGESQYVTNKSCYICFMGDKNALRVIS